jgi:hypothetical protein
MDKLLGVIRGEGGFLRFNKYKLPKEDLEIFNRLMEEHMPKPEKSPMGKLLLIFRVLSLLGFFLALFLLMSSGLPFFFWAVCIMGMISLISSFIYYYMKEERYYFSELAKKFINDRLFRHETLGKIFGVFFIFGLPFLFLIGSLSFYSNGFKHKVSEGIILILILVAIFIGCVAYIIVRKWEKSFAKLILKSLINDLNLHSEQEQHEIVMENYSRYVYSWKKHKHGKTKFYEIAFDPPNVLFEYSYFFAEKIEFDFASGKWKLIKLGS